MTEGMVFRPAVPADAYALAELSILAGDGMYEFLLEELAPREMLAGLISRGIKQDAGSLSWRHYLVAEDKGVIGMINAFPAAWLREEERDLLPQDRVQILDPIDRAQDWESFLVNGVAVGPQHRRQGIGARLLQMVIEQAPRPAGAGGKTGGFVRLTANVWADNVAARALFEKQGFAVRTLIEVAQHPGLTHIGGSLLMVRQVEV
jgi:ribosomal protein S18 acetylase RimI-like enzyme